MRNRKLDRICAKRLHSKDFAQGSQNYMPTSKFEIGIMILLAILALVLLACNVFKTYFA